MPTQSPAEEWKRLVRVLGGGELEVLGVLVVRREAGGDDLPEVGRLELVGLRQGGNGGLQEVTLGSSGTLGLGCSTLANQPYD